MMLLRCRRLRGFAAPAIALLAALSVSAGAWASPETDARELFESGVAMLKETGGPRYEEAYRAFKGAYQKGKSAKVLGNIAYCAQNLERDDEAIASYERYLAEVDDIEPAERAHIEKSLKKLRANTVTLSLNLEPELVTVVDKRQAVRGPSITNRYKVDTGRLVIRIRAGNHLIAVSAPGFETMEFRFEKNAGATVERTVGLESSGVGVPLESSRPVPGYVWAGFGVTGALVVATVVTGSLALSKNADYEALLDDDGNVTERDAADRLREDGETLNIATDVLLGASVAAAAITAVLFVTRPLEAGAVAFLPWAQPGSAGLFIAGSF